MFSFLNSSHTENCLFSLDEYLTYLRCSKWNLILVHMHDGGRYSVEVYCKYILYKSVSCVLFANYTHLNERTY